MTAQARVGGFRLHCKSGRTEHMQALFQRAVGGQVLSCQQARYHAVVKQQAKTSTDWSGLVLILVTITSAHAHVSNSLLTKQICTRYVIIVTRLLYARAEQHYTEY